MEKNKKIAIFGGSFSPPHLGHASVMEVIIRAFPCEEIWIMPSGDRYDKTITIEGKHREGCSKTIAPFLI